MLKRVWVKLFHVHNVSSLPVPTIFNGRSLMHLYYEGVYCVQLHIHILITRFHTYRAQIDVHVHVLDILSQRLELYCL